MKTKIVKHIIMEITNKTKTNKSKRLSELNKLLRFVKSSDYFIGKKRQLYKIIINAKK